MQQPRGSQRQGQFYSLLATFLHAPAPQFSSYFLTRWYSRLIWPTVHSYAVVMPYFMQAKRMKARSVRFQKALIPRHLRRSRDN